MSITKQEVDSRLHRYEPARPDTYYDALSIGPDGRLATRPPLIARDRALLDDAGADVALWDGTHGLDGIPKSPHDTPPSPAPSDVAHVRLLLRTLRDDAHSAPRVRSPQAAANAAMLAASARARNSAPKSSASLLAEACVRETHRDARDWYATFARPALLARALAHTLAIIGPAAPEARMHSAARAWARMALCAYADAVEAAQQLYAVETALASALQDVRTGTKGRLTVLENTMRAAAADRFVPAVLRVLRGDEEAWREAVGDVPRRKKTERLSRTYKLAGKLYDEVRKWKTQVATVAKDAAVKEQHAWENLLDVWENELKQM